MFLHEKSDCIINSILTGYSYNFCNIAKNGSFRRKYVSSENCFHLNVQINLSIFKIGNCKPENHTKSLITQDYSFVNQFVRSRYARMFVCPQSKIKLGINAILISLALAPKEKRRKKFVFKLSNTMCV